MPGTPSEYETVQARILAYAQEIGFSYGATWNSTSGRITFDTGLLELPRDLQDYVIVLELLHFHVPNHGKLWKSLIRAHAGDYELHEKRLRQVLDSQKGTQGVARDEALRRAPSR